ncbi:hypothetical protein ACQPW3_35835 [Actinosynnema sp. CA-248983]
MTVRMIPRKDAGYYPLHPEEPPTRLDIENQEPSLFTTRYMPLRKIVVMIDGKMIRDRQREESEAVSLLRWQLGNENVRFYSYPGCTDYLPYRDGKSLISYTEVLGTRNDDIRASLTAGMLGVDFYITERKRLVRERRWLNAVNSHYPPPEAPSYAPEEAAALIGLYLRAQGDFALPGEAKAMTSPQARSRFYAVGALSVIPALMNWRKIRAKDSEEDPLITRASSLARTVQERVEGALAQRDLAQMALRRSDDLTANFEIFGRLDSCLQLLMGTLDASARLAHLILGHKIGVDVVGPAHNVAWHRGKWLKALERHYPELFGLIAPNTSGWHTMTILRLLRNTIHAESIMTRTGGFATHWGEHSPLLKLSAEPEPELREALDAIADSGLPLGRCRPGDLVHPGELLESLFLRVVRLLDKLATTIPIREHEGIARLLDREDPFPYRYTEMCSLHLGVTPASGS